MKKLTAQEYLSLTEPARAIESDLHGPKVFRLVDGRMLKLFRRKRLLSSALWYPYARRFADNCQRLHKLGIPCPDVIDVFRIPSAQRDAVLYQPLAGEPVRHRIARPQSGGEADRLRGSLGAFVRRLHDQGVYFRSLHLGNVLCLPDGGLGLIDVADLRVFARPLGRLLRSRNLRHVDRYDADAAWLHENGRFLEAYRAGHP